MSRLLRLRPLLNLSKPSLPSRLSSTSAFSRGPAPPRLPADQQAEFERLQRQASVSSAFQHLVEEQSETPADASSTSAEPLSTSSSSSVAAEATTTATATEPATTATPTIAATDEDTMHPNYVRGAPAEFEGDVNPRTGEVGGPKREPLRWGSGGDWSYNGRVTDF
ncbi:hypothetical protein HER10_EVM0012339 [Colletotrichum scovillei]|uniref:Succinate dehydrogenase assembly factor 4, mitochondrial n=1 Tax=Colletotrichum scovillei TaxID=1209932 RepID=A0A9P7QZV6_9PEZI|nr:uncharacterized protein HER10_EVM0012339 [Colletotrichum scovillei]KAF4781475.1 hypothetical protein HER10_EVM0012339 [Colletotrichum scovillei]KAG7045307.1 FMP21-like protein [Colletotrichum scovillei]KAG7052469.1 FMP21-like protein [Colletotrichum scovillei]KAG7064759.1 FMP21-like protein [Colletotrichum scovillei]